MLHRPLPHLVVGQGDSRERGVEALRDDLLVVEPDDGHVGRDPQAQLGGRAVGSHGHAVVVAEERRRAGVGPQDLQGGLVAARGLGDPCEDEGVIEGDPGALEALSISGESAVGGGNVVGVGDEADPAVPVVDEVLDCRTSSARLVGHHGGDRARGVLSVDEDRRHTCEAGRNLDDPVVHRGVQDAVNLLAQENLHIPVDVGRGLRRVDEDEGETGLTRRLLGAQEDAPRVRGGGDVLAEQTDHLGALEAQAARHPVGPVAEAGGRVTDTLTRVVARPGVGHVVEDVRHGGDRDPRLSSDVPDPHGLPTHHRLPLPDRLDCFRHQLSH